MLNVLTLNNISSKGLDRLPSDTYKITDKHENPDIILVRSFKMHDMSVPTNLLAVGRAGAGVNNIPVEAMSELGIPVFNAPGANANAVKELVIAGMLLACRNICQSWAYTKDLQGDDVELNKLVEKGKKEYAGFELPGRTLGVIGLGAIGVRVANAAQALGMRVVGYDPTITVRRAWELSADVEQAGSVEDLINQSDFITVHVPLMDATRDLINAERLKHAKKDVVILNFARGGIVNDQAVIDALDQGRAYAYVCDFPSNENKGHPRVIALPHLGASTQEAEENCAIMVAHQVREFVEKGNIINSVNFPEVNIPKAEGVRLAIANRNIPNMVGQITAELAEKQLNIIDMLNRSRGNYAYTLIDVEGDVNDETLEHLKAIQGVLSVRAIR